MPIHINFQNRRYLTMVSDDIDCKLVRVNIKISKGSSVNIVQISLQNCVCTLHKYLLSSLEIDMTVGVCLKIEMSLQGCATVVLC